MVQELLIPWSGVIFLYGSIYFIGWLLSVWEKKTKENKIYKEWLSFKDWLQCDEPKYSDLHVYPFDWSTRRAYIAFRDRYTCKICGNQGELGFHVHHIIPLSKGGNNNLKNLIYLCRYCHKQQHPHMRDKKNQYYKPMRLSEEIK